MSTRPDGSPTDTYLLVRIADMTYKLNALLRIAASRGITVTIDTVERDEYDRGLGSRVTYTAVVAPGV